MKSENHPVLELNGLGVSFGQRVVLDGINLSLPSAGIDVLMGPVKSGKSTLFRTLAGLYDGHPMHKCWGGVTVLDVPVSRDKRPALIQQHARVLSMQLLQALLQPVRETERRSTAEWRQVGMEWLIAYGLGDFAELADQPLFQCNIRVQRSVQILAQALLKPSVLLIDEPTFGLSEADAAWLLGWIKHLSKHCKLWVVLHNQMQARGLADRIVLIGGGRLLAHQEVTQFFQCPANEWVEQFTRSGGMCLPAPDARAQDLADDVPVPPPLSADAQSAIGVFPTKPENRAKTKTDVSDITGSFQAFDINYSSVEYRRAGNGRRAFTRPECRKLVEISAPSRDGVELASAVGDYILRDSSAPRGFHWIVPSKLAGCPAPGVSAPIDYDLSLLARVGITSLITLTETDLDQDTLRRHNLTNIHLSVFDREAPSIGQTHMLLMRMQKLIDAGETLAVHCKAGLGRTGTILAAWLIREGGLTAGDSMERLRRIEPGFVQSKGQEDFLRQYEADLIQRLV